MTTAALCIGGPLDGELYAVSETRVIYEPDEPPFRGRVEDNTALAEPRRLIYRLRTISGERERFPLLVLEGMTMDQVFTQMVANYRPESGSAE